MVETNKTSGIEGVGDLRRCLLLRDSWARVANTARMCWTEDDSHPGGMERDGARFHHSRQFKTFKLLIAGIFHVTFLDCSCLRVTETTETKTQIRGTTVSASSGSLPPSDGLEPLGALSACSSPTVLILHHQAGLHATSPQIRAI